MCQLKSIKAKQGALKLQINFRKKVLGQTHPEKIVFQFSHNKRQFPVAELKENLLKLLSHEEPAAELTLEEIIHDPEILIYRRIEHQFDCDGELVWYTGTILSYDKGSKEFRVVYDNEEDEYSFPLIENIRKGEIRVM